MDSVTHIILGAACGEIVLGKKMGNRAMIWGSIGGSLPDLDVAAHLFMDPLSAMVFHRGPMHSLLFVMIIPFILGPLLKILYDGNWHKKKIWKVIGLVLGILLFVGAAIIICLIYNLLFEGIPWILISILLALGIYFFFKRYVQLFREKIEIQNASTREWTQLFFVSIVIHPLLDSLTTYGTVLFWPFNNTRVAISSIAIADPLFTIPFAILVMFVVLQQRDSRERKLFNTLGLSWAALYLILTFINKQHINGVFEKSLKEKQIKYSEYITVPTILNNVLWYGIAKQDSGYVYGYYSLLDKEAIFSKIYFIEGNHDLFNPYKGQQTEQILPWFSSDYYSLVQINKDLLQYNDLRYGSLSGKINTKDDYIFKFNLEVHDGILKMEDEQRGPENNRKDIEWFKKRIVGKE